MTEDVCLLLGSPTVLPRVSLCLIVRNEEANLPPCLRSAADLVDEVVVFDTGSTDRTREIATQLGARLHDFAWVDDLAAARNESLRHATGQWIFWLDADECLDRQNREGLRSLFDALTDENVAYLMKQSSVQGPDVTEPSATDHARLFRNHPLIRWEGRVYEQILPSVQRLGGSMQRTNLAIHHAGYQDQDLLRHKMERNLRLLQMDNHDHPQNPFTLFNLGMVFQELDRPADSVDYLRQSLERSPPDLSFLPQLYALLVQGYRRLGRGDLAWAASREGCTRYPKDASLLLQGALLLREGGNLAAAEGCLTRLLQGEGMGDRGIEGRQPQAGKARHELAQKRAPALAQLIGRLEADPTGP
jgi:tetratricopeptide (TPR) repeat protein